ILVDRDVSNGDEIAVKIVQIHLLEHRVRYIGEKSNGIIQIQLWIGEARDSDQHQSEEAADDFWPRRSLSDGILSFPEQHPHAGIMPAADGMGQQRVLD